MPTFGYTSQFSGRGRQNFWGRFPGRGSFPGRCPLTCYNCGRPGHIARLYRDPPRVGHQYQNMPQPYANAFEVFDASLSEYYDDNPWYMDSGATSHVTGNRINLEELHPCSSSQGIMTVGGETHPIQGSSNSNFQTPAGSIKLSNVKYVLTLKKSLISIGTIADFGSRVVFSESHCWVMDPQKQNHIIAVGHRNSRNGLYSFGNMIHASTVEKIDIQSLWHRRYGHLSFPGLQHLSKHGRVSGLPKIDPHHAVCEHCLSGRQSHRLFPRQSQNRASETAELIHSDLVGPMPQQSLGGSRYIIVLTDDYSRKS
jgi:hypothetical protein